MVKFIEEHPVDSNVTIVIGEIKIEAKMAEKFDTKTKRYLLLDAIRNEEGKLINIDGLNVVIEITDSEDKRMYKYTIGKRGYIKFKDNYYLVVFSSQAVNPFNARQAYRCPLSLNAVVQLIRNTKAIDCRTKDISFTGIALVVGHNVNKIVIGEECTISFEFRDSHYRIDGVVRRIEEQESGDKLIGIEFTKVNKRLTGLVAQLQRLEVRVRGEN